MISAPIRSAARWLLLFVALVPVASAVELAPGSTAPTPLKGPERVASPLLRPASDEARQAQQRFRIQPECKVELFAAEPLLGNPVAFTIDNLGRCYTAETYRYRSSVLDIRHYLFMLEDDMANRTVADREAQIRRNFPSEWQKLGIETEVIRLVQDRDGDGVAETSSVFADGFTTTMDGIASGILAHDGQVWFTNIPNVWRFDGPDEKGQATKREVISTGYGVRFSFTGHDLHGLILGPDGRLYFSVGDRGANVKTKEGRTIALPDEGGVFRCEPDGSHLELFCRGLRNPQELAFDNFGNFFTGDNDCDQGDQERWEYLVEGADYGWRVGWQHPPLGKAHNPWLVEKLWMPRFEGQAACILPPIANIPDGPSGVAFYPGTGLSVRYDDHFFICGFKGTSARSAISSWTMKANGAGFMLLDQHIYVGDCQATDVAFGPDSKMYFTEWGEGWEGTGRGRIFRVFDERSHLESRALEVQRLLASELKQKAPSELRDYLKYPDQRVRLEAEWALAKSPDGEQHFTDVAQSPAGGNEPTVARLHAIWGLGIIARHAEDQTPGAGAKKLEPLLPLLEDDDLEVRCQTAQVLGEVRAQSAFEGLLKMLRSPEERVSFFAAQALAKLGRREALGQLTLMINEAGVHDPVLRHGYVMALLGMNDFGALEEAAKHQSSHVRMASLLAMRRLGRTEIAQFLRDEDPLIVLEAGRAINDEGITGAYPQLAALVSQPASDETFLFRALNANFRLGTADSAKALATFAARADAPEPARLEAITELSLWAQPPARDRVAGVFRPLAVRDPAPAAAALRGVLPQLLAAKDREPLLLAAVEAVAKLGLKEEAGALAGLIDDAKIPVSVRSRALETLAAFNDAALPAAIQKAAADADPALRITAGAMLAKLDPEAAARQLARAFSTAKLPEQKAVLLALGGIQGASADQEIAELLTALRKGRIAPPTQLELLEAAAQHPALTVQTALKAYGDTLPKNDPLAAFRVALVGGDKARGETLFKEHAAAACLRCHKVKGSGGEAGPDLSVVAATKDRAYLLESIIQPNAKIAEGFQMLVVTMKNGDIQAGLVKSEDDAELVLQTPGLPLAKLKKADIKARDTAPSGMPPNMADLLTKRDIRDLVEYLASLKEK
jgi:quinoprotein glucose dehydrogenase